MPITESRRHFFTRLGAASVAGFGCLGGAGRCFAADGPPETTSVRINKSPSICVAPQHIAKGLLQAEGFTDIRYVTAPVGEAQASVANGDFDFVLDFAPNHIAAIDRGLAITILAGVNIGCFELFAAESIH